MADLGLCNGLEEFIKAAEISGSAAPTKGSVPRQYLSLLI